MSNYQRLISYIYTYEGGIKGKNIGFAKLETRGNQCRITVSVKKIFVGGNPIGIYLLAGQDEIKIGTLFARNGAGEFRALVNAQNVEGSGHSLEECYGLTVHDTESAWRCYTTIWEDAVAHAAEIELADVTAENTAGKSTEKSAGKADAEGGGEDTGKSDRNGAAGTAEPEPLPISKAIEEELEREELGSLSSEIPRKSQAPEGWAEAEEIAPERGAAKTETAARAENGEQVKETAWTYETVGDGSTEETGRAAETEEMTGAGKTEESDETAWPGERKQGAAEDMAQEVPGGMAEKIPEKIAEETSEKMEEGLPGKMTEETLEKMAGEVPEEMAGEALEGTAQWTLRSAAPRAAAPYAARPVPSSPHRGSPHTASPGALRRETLNTEAVRPGVVRRQEAEPVLDSTVATDPQAALQADPQAALQTDPQAALQTDPQAAPQEALQAVPASQEAPVPQADPQAAPADPQADAPAGAVPPSGIHGGLHDLSDNCSEQEMWEQLRKRYPKIQAFDYADGCEILSIKPQDIGLLPRETWVYGNNSFLLHGYYNYRYLILARLNNPLGKARYLLGVPGHYFSNEKYMASMFGFPDFVLSKKQPPRDGRFGYWYTDIKIGD